MQIISYICTTQCLSYSNLVTGFPKVKKKKKKMQSKIERIQQGQGKWRSKESQKLHTPQDSLPFKFCILLSHLGTNSTFGKLHFRLHSSGGGGGEEPTSEGLPHARPGPKHQNVTRISGSLSPVTLETPDLSKDISKIRWIHRRDGDEVTRTKSKAKKGGQAFCGEWGRSIP